MKKIIIGMISCLLFVSNSNATVKTQNTEIICKVIPYTFLQLKDDVGFIIAVKNEKDQQIRDTRYSSDAAGILKNSVGGDISTSFMNNKGFATKKDLKIGDISLAIIKFWRYAQTKDINTYAKAHERFILGLNYTNSSINNIKMEHLINSVITETNGKINFKNYSRIYYMDWMLNDLISNPYEKDSIKNLDFQEFINLVINYQFQEALDLLNSDNSYFASNEKEFNNECLKIGIDNKLVRYK